MNFSKLTTSSYCKPITTIGQLPFGSVVLSVVLTAESGSDSISITRSSGLPRRVGHSRLAAPSTYLWRLMRAKPLSHYSFVPIHRQTP